MHCFSKSYITVVGTDAAFDARTNARLSRLAERLRDPQQVCVVDTTWGASGMTSYLTQQLGSLLDEVRSID